MKFKKIVGILVLTFLSFSFLGTSIVFASEPERAILILPESVNVQGSELLLGKIAEITGPEGMVEKIAAINAGAAPASGSSRRLTKAQIEVRLRQGGLDLNNIEFQGVETIQVYGITANPVIIASNQEETGFPIYEVVVAAVDLPRYHVISRGDLEIKAQEFRSGQPDLRTVEDFVGLRTNRYVSCGSALTTLNVEVVPIIERGAQVTIVVQTDSIVVTAPGIARGTGGLGDVISVQNTLSKQVISAEIVDVNTVRVNIGGSGTP